MRLLRRSNIGFSAANNLVLRETRARSVLLLNPDTEITGGAVDACLERLDSDPRIGMVGCKLITPDGELDHACKRSFPTPLGALAHFAGIGRRATAPRSLSQYRATDLGPDDPGEVDAVNGAFMLVRMDTVAEVGRPRRGLLALHGGPRLVLPLLAAGMAGLLRAPGHDGPRQGG